MQINIMVLGELGSGKMLWRIGPLGNEEPNFPICPFPLCDKLGIFVIKVK